MQRDDETIFNYNYEPFMFLEGQTGLNDCERIVSKILNDRNYRCWVLDDLYENPDRLVAIQYLKPKTIILGTTGLYKNELDYLFKIAAITDLSSIEKVILTLKSEEVIRWDLKQIQKKYPKMTFYSFGSVIDYDSSEVEIYQIEL